MKATVGDRIVIMSRHLGEPLREGEILEAHGAEGEPIFPGPDATIRHVSPS